MPKDALLYQHLVSIGLATNTLTPTAPDADTLGLVHERSYVDAFLSGTIREEYMRRIGLPWSRQLVRRTLIGVGSALEAARHAVNNTVATWFIPKGVFKSEKALEIMPCIWNDWLPKAISDEIKHEEPKRAMLDAKADPGVAYMQKLAETLFDIVLCSENDLTVQARWGGILHRILRSHGKKMDLKFARLVAEHSVLVSSFDIGMDSGGESEEEPSDEEDDESVGTAEDGVDSSVTDEDIAAGGMDGMESSSKPLNGKFPRRHLAAETRMAIVKLVMRLALKGQSGKDSIMRRYSSQVLCMLANIEPRIVLPEVERHFVTALET
eukprot:jgi/Picre1/33494/NNA_008818.t1